MTRTTYKIWTHPAAGSDDVAQMFDTIAALFHVSLATNGNWNERTFVETSPDHETAFDIRDWAEQEGFDEETFYVEEDKPFDYNDLLRAEREVAAMWVAV